MTQGSYRNLSKKVDSDQIFTWEGKKLTSFTKGDLDISYSYNDTGIRTSKTVDGITTEYRLNGNRVTFEKTGTAEGIYFVYDNQGQLLSMIYYGHEYAYVRNAQNDIVGMVDENGTQVVSYEYSTWGEVLSITDTSNANVGNLNPYRYRGYRLDSETGLYYLQSRYYNPQWGRFLNADDTNAIISNHEHLMQYNLFAYAFNNPANRFDDAGFWPGWVNKVLIGTAVIAIAAVLVATAGAGTPLACFAAGALHGATVGAISGAAYGAVTGVVVNRLKTGSWKGSGMAALNGAADGYMMGAITGFIAGGVSSSQCFVAGTVVLTSVGYAAIETIRAGDLVWSENPETGQQSLKTVVQTFENETSELVHVFVGDEEILTTMEHPFYVRNKGWVGASNLQQGDIVELKDGLLEVFKVEIEITKNPVKVYNFEVEDFHTYFVSDDSILVHNLCAQKSQFPVEDGARMKTSDALDVAEDFLKDGYKEAVSSRFISADGMRQVRMSTSDLLGKHGGGPHINLDVLKPVYRKIHIFLID